MQYTGDSLSAIYHFKWYLSLRPKSSKANLARQRVGLSVCDFVAKMILIQELKISNQRVDLIAAMDKLKTENN